VVIWTALTGCWRRLASFLSLYVSNLICFKLPVILVILVNIRNVKFVINFLICFNLFKICYLSNLCPWLSGHYFSGRSSDLLEIKSILLFAANCQHCLRYPNILLCTVEFTIIYNFVTWAKCVCNVFPDYNFHVLDDTL